MKPMTTRTTLKSPGALALGIFFTAVTALTIFDDVRHGAEITVAHIQAAAALVAAIAAGHFILPTFKSGRLPATIGLLLIFFASTAYIVTSAGARNAEVSGQKTSALLKRNAERADQRAAVIREEAKAADAKAKADAATLEAAKECRTGKETKCLGKESTRDFLVTQADKTEDAAKIARGKVSLSGPDEMPNEGYKQAAKVFEAAGIGTYEQTAARLELLMPFALVLISEISTIVFLGMAFGTAPPARLEKIESLDLTFANSELNGPTLPSPSLFAGELPEPTPPKPGKPMPTNILPFANHPAHIALKKAGGEVGSNRELAGMQSVCDGEGTKRVDELVAAGVAERKKIGKRTVIRLTA
jgi:hypothetical protein